MTSLAERITFMWGGLGTKRYHTEITIKEQSVGQHSAGVALLCDLLYEGETPACVLRAALFHDLAEHVLGDMPSPAKRKLGIRTTFQKHEDVLLKEYGFFVNLSEHDALALSLADALDGMLWCLQERRLGNKGINQIFGNFHKYVTELLHAPGGIVTHSIGANILDAIIDMWKEACK